MAQQIDIVANLLMKVDGAEAGINKLKNSLSKLEVPKGLENSFNKSFSNLDNIFERYRKQLSKGFDTKADVSNMSKIGKELDAELTKVSNHIQKLTGEKIDFKVDSEPVKRATRDLEEILEKRRQLAQEKLEVKVETPKDNINNIKQLLEEFQRVLGSTNAGKAAGKALSFLDAGDIEKAIPLLKEAESNLTRIGEKKREAFSGTGFTLEGALAKIVGELTKTDSEFSTVNDKAKLFQRALTEAQTGQLKDVGSLLDRMSQGFDKTASSAREAAKAGNDYAQSMFSMQQQVSQLQQSTQYFFSLRNMINLLKRGIREAVQTVKELDAAMTETAVVTKFDVGDMWAKLPEYTANANALGATVQDMYESTTLYYQQGLNAQQAMSIASETMKMARIGGLEAAEATDMMTAALRGFNMELNETSAQRINDVYSNLAAKTASNTEELGTAMQRTASIAASAGMSFEGTTAFLAQAIETTREPAENLGTAMKTIIARFQELKKNPLEMTEVDGETVDYNKVDAALKTIGVDLKDTNGQFRNLDQVFLDISKRWDSLTQTQQRYIATTAAGSRQQSRFIAMMSNYDRTMQLMDYANNADGASNEQFGKTLESLEAKLNKFKNAWKEFLMGIMNDSWTKKIVDGATGVLNTINSIISALSLGSKGIKSALSLFTAFTALRVAGRGANALIGGLGGMVDPQSTARAGMRTGAIGRNSAQAINQPIVRELQSIRALIAQKINSSNLGRNQVTGPYDEYNRFREARSAVAQMGGKGTIGDLKKQLSGLSASNQNLLMSGNAGTFAAATDAIIDKYKPENRKAVRLGERFLNNQRKSAQITAEEYYTALQDPGLLKKAMTKAGVQKDNPAYQYIDGLDKAVTQRAKNYENEAIKKFDEAVKGKNIDEEALERARKALSSDQAKENYRRRALEKEGGASSQQINFSTSKLGKALDGVGKIGTGISQAGMGLQAFGSILTGSANPAIAMFGSLLTSTGGLISGIGMGISSLSMGFTTLAKSALIENVASRILTAAKGAEAASSAAVTATATMLTGGLLVLVAVIAAVAFGIKKYNEHIKKAAEEVTKTYQDKSQENQTNLANLKQWKSELAVLSKGVDENGLNVSLDASDYQHYLEIVDGIAKINPSIVKGYNAQGHAIIDNNNALEKTLELEERRAKQIVSDYTNDDSLRKLLRARNLERQYRAGGGNGDKYIETIDFELKPRTDMRHQISQIGSELRRNKDKIDLSALGIDIDALASGSEAEFRKVANNIDLFRQIVTDSIDRAGDEWSDASRESIEKAFDAYGDSSAELDELTQPLYDALSVKASQTAGFQNMAENLKVPFQNALKDLAVTGDFTNGKDIGNAAKNMALKFAGYNDIYLDAMQKVESANKQFALDFNEANYDANTEDAITELENLKTTLEDTPEGHAISEWIDNEIRKIENHLTDGVASVEQAWNTMSDKIAVAESAAEDFKKATEKDYSTAAEGMKEIYDTAMGEDTYHSIGYGDNTFWAAAEKLLGKNNIMDLETDQVRGMMKEIEPFLKEGPEGVQNFASKVAGLSDSLDEAKGGIKGVKMTSDGWFESIDDNANPEVWKELSNALGISEELLTSMLNKARQFRKMSFSDMNAIREAYAADDTVIHGVQKTQITTTDENGVEQTVSANKLYITDAELQNQMGSDYYNAEERGKKEEELNAKGIEVLPEHLKNLDVSMMKNELGIQNMTDAIETFGKTGAFDKTEIQDAARIIAKEQLGDKFDEETFNKEFNDEWAGYLENMEYPTLEPLQSIENLVATIADNVTTKQIERGILAERRSEKINEAINGEADVDDTLADFFRQGKDVHGNDLNAYTYQAGLNELQDLRTSTQSYLDSLEKGRDRASTKEERDRFDEEIANTKKSLQALNDAIEAGTKEFEESQKPDEQNPNDSTSTSTKPSPYTEEQEAYYSRNAIGEWFNNLFKGGGSDYEYSTGSRESYSAKEGAGGSQDTSESSSAMTEAASGLNTAGTTLTESGTTLSEGTTNLAESATNLTEAGTNLSTASESLGTAAQNLTSAAAIIVANGQGGGNGGSKSTSQTPSAESSISGIVVIDNSAALESLDDLKAKAEETKGVIESKATFTVDVSGADKLDKASKAASNLVSKNGSSASIAVSTGAVDKKSVKQGIAEINRSKATILVDANTQSALQKARNLANTIDSYHATIDIYPNFTGSWTKTVYVKEVPGNAKGQNNYGIVASPPALGSAARGRYGQLGPKGKGGLTLTGELGYEIAWLPSENRSMILGADGPQMVNLPGDAVVWTHEQSKKMMAQKTIPAGSHVLKSSSGWNFSNNSGNSTGGGTGYVPSTITETANNIEDAVEETTKKIVKVSVWWENIARKTEYSQRQMDKSQKAFEKYTKDLRVTLRKTGIATSKGGGGGDDYIKKIGNYIGYNQSQLARAEKELKGLDTWKKGVENQDKRKAKYGNQGYENIVQISWTGDDKESHEAYADLAGYIKFENGTYVIDQAQLNKIKDTNQRKATADAANKEIDDRLSRKYKAEDNITRAQEALEKMSEELYKTFFGWETSLTKIWNITQRIERITNKLDRTESYATILEGQIGSGIRKASDSTAQQELNTFKKRLNQQNSILIERQNAIKQAITDVKNAVSTADERAELATINQKLKSKSLTQTERLAYEQARTELTKKIATIEKAQNYLTIKRNSDGTVYVNFNADALQRDRVNGTLTEEMAKGIEEYVKNLKESSDNLDELYNTLNSDIANYFSNLIELQDQWADYEEQLIQIEEESNKKEVDRIKKLSDSIKKAIDELLKEVKNKLDERRKQEDNAKTEQDIFKQQQRLSMLRADTSGGHAVEIAQLEKEIADAQQNYQRSLEDQLIEKLQNQADKAQEQREKQIEIQEELASSVNNIEQVNQWMANPTNFKKELKQAYRDSNDYDKKGNAGQAKIDRDFEVFYEGLITNQNKQAELRSAIQENTIALEALNTAITAQNNHNLTAKEAKKQGATLKEVKNAYNVKELKEAGWNASDFYKAGISASKAYEAGFKPKEIHDAGYNLSQFKNGTKLGVKEAYKAGYTDPKALAKEYGVLNTMQTLNAGGKTVQDALGKNNNATIAKVQEWINAKDKNGKKKYSNLTQTDLAGMKADLTVNGKKVTGSVTTGGKYVYANVGSTLYGQALDSKGKLTGRLSTTSIQNLTPAYFKGNKTEATQALLYAIQHQKPGSVINKNFKSLIQAAGIVGKEYQIDTGSYKVMASIGGDGNIYYNVKDGVQIWSPSKGTLWLDKYNEKRFKERAKWTTSGREYKQVLHAKGVKGYATGGLADYTGPAWLDGTPAKPELILNAQDTKNFIALKDVLSKAIGSTHAISNEYGGDTTFEININVDHIANDYDVDKMAERVKKIIVKDSSYRNVTQVRKFR